ncbi:hypothetical protein KM043_006028 [Ampulex compressa]|nr:hypothetical protein KM043_006028 [Ampulex compressa]
MELRTFCRIALFVGIVTIVALVDANPVSVTEASTSEEQKVLLECQHSDYRTYIKCLKRQKRHHFLHGDTHPEIDGACMEACLKKCEGDYNCDKKCTHCVKRAKHKHQIITEYETDCGSGDCNKSEGLGTTNITTNIDINNVINTCGSGSCGSNATCPPCAPSVIPIEPRIPNDTDCCPHCTPPVPCNQPPIYPPPAYPPVYPPPGYPPPGYPPSGYPPSGYPPSGYSPPSYTPPFYAAPIVPQVAYGYGMGPIGACMYSLQWPCIPYYPTLPGVGIDCSGCGYPVLQHRCDVSCYTIYGNRAGGSYYGQARSMENTAATCKRPYCVGGTS